MDNEGVILEVDGLRTGFPRGGSMAYAVDGVSFRLHRGEVLGVVGESGSGKTLCALSILGLIDPPGRITGGRVLFENRNLLEQTPAVLRSIRGRRISMIFQEPMTALNPVIRCGRQIAEMRSAHGLPGDHVHDLLARVGIPNPARTARAWPHELSGGMRQRVMIAMAIACRPDVLIADEPTTALDVTTQAQILNLLDQLRRDTGMAILFISHDLGVIADIADRVIVMYAGQIQEISDRTTLFTRPAHPYTQGLMAAMPRIEKVTSPLPVIPGLAPGLGAYGAGCRFAPRCPLADDQCRQEDPPLQTVTTGHLTRCWKPGETAFSITPVTEAVAQQS